jgi:pimeloyl-ACP methyl ester carboxylesterase
LGIGFCSSRQAVEPYGSCTKPSPSGSRTSAVVGRARFARNVTEFQRTGFHGGLNYYRAAEPYFYLSAAWKGAKITQPSFFIAGKADGLEQLYPPTDQLRPFVPGLVGRLDLDDVGHWVQHEASAAVSDQLVKFLRSVNPT